MKSRSSSRDPARQRQRSGDARPRAIAKVPEFAPAAAARHAIRPPRMWLYIDAVARHGSIRKAADALHIASSALNRRVLDLEQELGTTLFERLPRGVRLTAAGELFVAYVRRSLSELALVGSQVEQLRGLVRGRVRLAATESTAGELLPGAIARFQTAHPRVRFDVTIGAPGGLVALLLDDTVDLVLTHVAPEHPDVVVLAVRKEPFCALVGRNHPLVRRASVRVRDCLAYPIALGDASLAGRTLIERALAKSSQRLEPALVSNSVELMKAYAQMSDAVCFQFRVGGLRDVASGDMVAIPLADATFQGAQLILAARRGRVLPVAAATFGEEMKNLIGSA